MDGVERLIVENRNLKAALEAVLIEMEASGGWEGDDDLFDFLTEVYRNPSGDFRWHC